VPVASDILLDFPWRARDVRQALRRAPGPRLVVKPVREGSSVGVHICTTLAQAARAVRALRSFRQPVLIEEFVEGREVTVAVLGEQVLPPVEIVPARAFYDTTAKYDPTSGTRYDVAPSLPPAVLARAKDAALEAHRALGCRDVSRTDVRIDPSGRPFVLEVNTIPGLTPTSLLPKAAAAAGIRFDELCEKLIRLALGRGRA
jgi:D-alanine-D-alanine ligase